MIGLSATPLAKDLGKHFSNLVRGPSVRELTEMGSLVPVKAYCPSQKMLEQALEGVKIQAGDFADKGLSHALNRKELIGDIVSTYQDKGEGRQALCFAVDIAHSKAITDDFIAHGIPAAHIDGSMKQDERDEILDAFRGGTYRILSSVYVLGVGFDYPAVSCAILARPTLSEMLDMQQKGRVLRPADGKDDAIILDHAGNCVRFGLPEHFEVPELNQEDKPTARKKRKQRKMIICPECSAMIEPGQSVCLSCGIDRPVKRADVGYLDGTLIEYGTVDPESDGYSLEDKVHWYRGFKWYAEQRGFQPGWAFYTYLDKFHEKPSYHWKQLGPEEPETKILNWIKYRNIKQAKSRRRAKPVPRSCRICGSSHLVQQQGTGPHAHKLTCGDCGSFIQWLPKNHERRVEINP